MTFTDKLPRPTGEEMCEIIELARDLHSPAAGTVEFLYDALGRRRELKKIPGNHQYAPGEDEILAWFRQLGVTHVEVAPEWHDTVPAKTYTLKTFARHMRRVSKEAEA